MKFYKFQELNFDFNEYNKVVPLTKNKKIDNILYLKNTDIILDDKTSNFRIKDHQIESITIHTSEVNKPNLNQLSSYLESSIKIILIHL